MLMRVFFFSVLVVKNYSENKSYNYSSSKKNINSIHFSPLSAAKPIIKNTTKAIEPPINIETSNFSRAINCPITSAVKMYLLKSKKTLPKFSLCFFVKRIISKILSRIKNICQVYNLQFFIRGGVP